MLNRYSGKYLGLNILNIYEGQSVVETALGQSKYV